MASAVALSRGTIRKNIRIPRLDSQSSVLFVLLGLTLVQGVLYALINPPLSSPDELGHFQYVANLATGGASPQGSEAHQPMPYYALLLPAFWLSSGQSAVVQSLAVRFASLAFLLGIVLFTWLAAKRLAPSRPTVPVIATAIVALHPGLAYIGASINSDSAANFMGAVLTYLVVSVLVGRRERWVVPATVVALGAAMFTKSQIFPMVAVSGAVLSGYILAAARGSRRQLFFLFVGALALVGAVALRFATDEVTRETAIASASLLLDWPKLSEVAQQSAAQQPIFYYTLTTFWVDYWEKALHLADGWLVGPAAVVLVGGARLSVRDLRRGDPGGPAPSSDSCAHHVAVHGDRCRGRGLPALSVQLRPPVWNRRRLLLVAAGAAGAIPAGGVGTAGVAGCRGVEPHGTGALPDDPGDVVRGDRGRIRGAGFGFASLADKLLQLVPCSIASGSQATIGNGRIWRVAVIPRWRLQGA